MTRLFDASSLVEALLLGRVEATFDQHALDLTFYEAGNALWNHRHLRERIGDDRSARLVALLGGLRDQLAVEPVDALDLSGTMTIAREESITFYDAAYLACAERESATLVTEDGALADAAASYVDTVSLEDI